MTYYEAVGVVGVSKIFRQASKVEARVPSEVDEKV